MARTCCWWRHRAIEMAPTLPWLNIMWFLSVGLCERTGLCPATSYMCRRTQGENHWGSEDCYTRHAAASVAGTRLPTWCVPRHKRRTHWTFVITLEHFKITISHNFFLEICRIKLVMFTIKPIKFHFSSPNIHSHMDISNDVKFLGTPCI